MAHVTHRHIHTHISYYWGVLVMDGKSSFALTETARVPIRISYSHYGDSAVCTSLTMLSIANTCVSRDRFYLRNVRLKSPYWLQCDIVF